MQPPLRARSAKTLSILGTLVAALFAVQALLDLKLQEGGAPGILALEVAGSADRAREILAEWGPDRLSTARASVIVDIPFIICSALFFSLACSTVANGLAQPALFRLGGVMAWAPLAAGVLDAAEDGALLQILAPNTEQPWPAIAAGAASVKFVLIAGILLYLTTTLIVRGRSRRRGLEP